MDESRGREQPRIIVAGHVLEASSSLHYAAHLLGDDELARRLRWIADLLHDLGKSLKRG